MSEVTTRQSTARPCSLPPPQHLPSAGAEQAGASAETTSAGRLMRMIPGARHSGMPLLLPIPMLLYYHCSSHFAYQNDLGGEVLGGAAEGPRLAAGLHDLGEAEVAHLDVPVLPKGGIAVNSPIARLTRQTGTRTRVVQLSIAK